MCVQVCFDLFDTKKQDYLSADDLDEIMRAMGFRPSKEELQVQQSPFPALVKLTVKYLYDAGFVTL